MSTSQRARALLGPQSAEWPSRLERLLGRTPSEADTVSVLLSDTVDKELATILVEAFSKLQALPDLTLYRLYAYATHDTHSPTESQLEALAVAIRANPTHPLAISSLERLQSSVPFSGIERLLPLTATIPCTPSTLALYLKLLELAIPLSPEEQTHIVDRLWPHMATAPFPVLSAGLWSIPPLHSHLLARAQSDYSLALSAVSHTTPPELHTLVQAWTARAPQGLLFVQRVIAFVALRPDFRAYKPLLASLLAISDPATRQHAFRLLARATY